MVGSHSAALRSGLPWRVVGVPLLLNIRIQGGLIGANRGLNVPRPLVSEHFRTSMFDCLEALGCHIPWRDLLLGDRCGHIGIDESGMDADDKGSVASE